MKELQRSTRAIIKPIWISINCLLISPTPLPLHFNPAVHISSLLIPHLQHIHARRQGAERIKYYDQIKE